MIYRNQKTLLNIRVSLDSRLIKPGDYFVPVVGENFDGHSFIKKAFKKGALGVIEEESLYKMASEKLKLISPTIIAVTGSLGKTTTTRFIYDLLSSKYKVCLGNLNTKLGLAVNIMNNLDVEDLFFVAECGMDRKGELLRTGSFLNPNVVVLTHASVSHAEKLGTLDDIKQAKSELVRTLKKGGVLFYNSRVSDVRDIISWFPKTEKISYGFFKNNSPFNLAVSGLFSLEQKINAHGAYKIAKYFGVSKDILLESLKNLKPPKGRLNILKGKNNSLLLDDTYNASPDSTIASLRAFKSYVSKTPTSRRKVFILGHMAELGRYEKPGYFKVANYLLKNIDLFDLIVFVGKAYTKMLQTPLLKRSNFSVKAFEDSVKAGMYLRDVFKPKKGDLLLFKGSQSARMEKAVKLVLDSTLNPKDILVRQDSRWDS